MCDFQKQFSDITHRFHQISPASILNDFVQLICVMLSSPFFHENLFKQASTGTLYADPRFRKSLTDDGQKYPLGLPEAINKLTRVYLIEVFNSEPFKDILGPVYEELSTDQRMSQFFTPPSIGVLLSEMHFYDASQHLQADTPLLIHDSCCGAGALLLTNLCKFYKVGGAKAIGRVEVFANDIDLNLCKITTVQVLISCALKKLPLRRFQISNYDILKDLFNEECRQKVVFDWTYQANQDEVVH
jgi:hypothetical protein